MSKQFRRKAANNLGAWVLVRLRSWLEKKTPTDAERAGQQLGRLFYRVARSRRTRCLKNLALAMPEMDKTAREDLCKRVFEHYGMVTADFLRGRLRTPQDVIDSVEVENFHHLEEAFVNGKGAILVTGHFGNWERMSALVAAHGYSVSVVARDTADSQMNNLLSEMRGTTGSKVISRGNAARPMIEALRRNGFVGILPDQNADEIYIPFFGHPAGTVLGPGVIAERTQSPVICCWCARVGPNRYRMWVEPPLEPLPGEVKGEGMMRAIHQSLERVIREYPEQWLWFHDRWRNARKKGLIPEEQESN